MKLRRTKMVPIFGPPCKLRAVRIRDTVATTRRVRVTRKCIAVCLYVYGTYVT